MNRSEVSQFEQIKAILLEAGCGYDRWSERNLNIPSAEGERFIIHELFKVQKSFWGYKPTVYFIKGRIVTV
ncbi:hypothetical protein [Acinetobacter boissieri]|uniref:Uncharacterized protein n=1 Tax=Acinetobacter boissieri TaxID=1219383 RepID=A0A1G6H6A6_9GAMM|nr:hypothetical protein [Acinetobacter boissieri]SDB89787.1 hypothetical protein SAMN05421733_10452 [Acinetobacter boissieri]